MTEKEFAVWKAVTESSRDFWTEDEIYRLNGRGSMYYLGGEDGTYMQINKDGKLDVGTYEGAVPHIGEAIFKSEHTKQYANYSDAFTAALELGGKKFLADMFSGHKEEAIRAAEKAFEQKESTTVKHITAGDLRTLPVNEGLVVQGCGGDLKEWVDGINDTLTEEGILLEGDKFTDVYAFEHDGLTNMLFSMDDVNLNVGKMAMWRLASHDTFGGTWLSDYVPNRLGVEREPLEAPQETGDITMGGIE